MYCNNFASFRMQCLNLRTYANVDLLFISLGGYMQITQEAISPSLIFQIVLVDRIVTFENACIPYEVIQ